MESVLVKFLESVGPHAATVTVWILIYHKWIAPKSNGARLEQHEALFTAQTKELLHRFDMALLMGFTQLQKDLSHTIQTTMQKETENAMTKALFNMWQARDRK